MDLKTALAKLKASRNEPLHFFFCEAGAEGKPVLMIGKEKIKSTERDRVLETAKKTGSSVGMMHINAESELVVVPRGKSAPATLAAGVQKAAREAGAMVFSGVRIADPVADPPKDQKAASDRPDVPPAAPPADHNEPDKQKLLDALTAAAQERVSRRFEAAERPPAAADNYGMYHEGEANASAATYKKYVTALEKLQVVAQTA